MAALITIAIHHGWTLSKLQVSERDVLNTCRRFRFNPDDLQVSEDCGVNGYLAPFMLGMFRIKDITNPAFLPKVPTA